MHVVFCSFMDTVAYGPWRDSRSGPGWEFLREGIARSRLGKQGEARSALAD
jgi:hypothetical protein